MRTLEDINAELEQVRQKLDRARKLSAVMEDLKAQHEERKRAAEDALKVLYREQEDVEELERLSFASFLARIRGEQAERLDQERREAVAAKARYDAARRDLEDLEARFQAAQKERAGLEGLRGRWKALMEEKEELLCQAGGERAKRLIQIGCDLDSLGAQIRELDEAICAGKDVGYALDQMIGQLDSAAGWGTWDILGGGMLATMAKHGRMNDAQNAAFQARQAISRFRTELADVSQLRVPDLQVGEFTSFADYFFDGLFVDLYIQDKIGTARRSAEETAAQVEDLLSQLRWSGSGRDCWPACEDSGQERSMDMEQEQRTLQKWVDESRRIVFFGGAGVSTESGIPDFRSVDGLYHQKYDYPPEEILSRSFFDARPEEFYRFYREKMLCLDAQPNPAHRKLAELEAAGKLTSVVTQNIDGLHQRAGSRRVWELHGSVHRNHCMGCGRAYPVEFVRDSGGVPRCACGGIVKPDVVLYEEQLDGHTLQGALSDIQGADMLIIGGTSLAVYPAASLVNYYRGHRLVLINKSPTPYDAYADLVIVGPIGEILGGVAVV